MMCAAFSTNAFTTNNTTRTHQDVKNNMTVPSVPRSDDTVMTPSSSLHRHHKHPHNDKNDISGNSNSSSGTAIASASTGTSSFPLKLHAMLNEIEQKGGSFAETVAWQEGGKSFKVYDVEKFGSHVLPRYFNQTKFKSFQRQLNMYGFRRIQHGKLKGGYVHKSFVRGKPELSNGVKRRSNHQTHNKSRKMAVAAKVVELVAKASAAASNGDGSNPVSVAELFDDTPIQDYMASVDFGEDFNMSVLEEIFRDDNIAGDPNNGKGDDAARTPGILSSMTLPQAIAASSNPEVAAAVFQEATEAVYRTIEKMDDFLSDDDEKEGEVDTELSEMKVFLRTLLDDTVDDEEKVASLLGAPATSSSVQKETTDDVHHETAEPWTSIVQEESIDSSSFSDEDKESEEQLSERVFPLKLHKMLENAHRDGLAHIVSWVDDGRGFKVYNSEAFTKEVMPMYFDQTKYESFRRQLNLYGFTRVSRGPRRGIYSHPMFLAGNRPLVIAGVRRKVPTTINGDVGNSLETWKNTTATEMGM